MLLSMRLMSPSDRLVSSMMVSSMMKSMSPLLSSVDESDANASNRLPSLIAPGSLAVIVTGVTCLGLVDVIGVVGFIGCRL